MVKNSLARRVREHARQRTLVATTRRALKNLGTSYLLESGVMGSNTERSARSFLGNRLTAQHNLRLVRFIESKYESITQAAGARQNHALSMAQEDPMRAYSYWNSGRESAPEVVRLCFERLDVLCDPMEAIILDSESVLHLIEPPVDPWFVSLSETKKSNLYRMMLLHQYGGFWMDATCFLRDRPHTAWEEIGQKAEFFAFSGKQPGEIQNFFFAAKPAHPIFAKLIEAWMHVGQHYDGILPYFWFQVMFKALYHLDDDVRLAWNNMPKVDWNIPHELPRLLYGGEHGVSRTTKYEASFVHKLTVRSVLPEQSRMFLIELINQ